MFTRASINLPSLDITVNQNNTTMKKLSIHNFHDLSEDVQESIVSEFSEHFNPEYLAGDDLNNVNAEVALDEFYSLVDIRVFDPFQTVNDNVYIGPDG